MDHRKKSESIKMTQSHETTLLDLIRSKGDMGIFKGDLKQTGISDTMINKALKLLQAKDLIKEVTNIKFKAKKYYMAKEFEPSKELTGGTWYSDGKLDSTFIEFMGATFLKIIQKFKVASCDIIADFIKKHHVTTVECTKEQIHQILNSMVLDNVIIKVKSTGVQEYHPIPLGMDCYRLYNHGKSLNNQGAMASIPCGVCPRISKCTPDGIISPKTCAYFQKWLDF